MNLNRRSFISASAAVASSTMLVALAQSFPSKPITLIVPFAPGGNIDVLGRTLSASLSKILGQSIIVDNRAGGGGSIGAALVAKAPADGYTLLVATPGQIVTVPQMIKTSYSSSSFKPVGVASRTSMVIVAKKNDSRFKTISELINYAKANPGKVNAGHAGPGTPNHLAATQFEEVIKSDLNIISYRGSGPALTDLIGGQIDVHFDQVTSSMPHIKSGSLQALAVLGPKPEPALPGTPTLAQAGFGSLDGTTYAGLFAPSEIPQVTMNVLSAALQTATQDPKMISTLSELGSNSYWGPASEFTSFLNAEADLAAKLVKSGRLKAE